MDQKDSATTESAIDEILQKIIDNNPYGFILRPDIHEKTGGLISRGHAANLDSRGQGISNRFMVGNTTAYPVESVVEFLRAKIKMPKTSPAPLP